ncbi:hypothetical protein G6L37_34885 [Agrobacterium rubi]|nr:hypothetical protein [Agrobacterium rubi]NTF23755.1 hypothetical protein [Agrobacterium rubi]
MSKLGEFMEKIRQDAKVGALLAAAGLFAAISPTHSLAAGPASGSQQRVLVDNITDANDLNERVSDQLGGMKPLSDALNYSVSYGSANVSGVQKAKNLAIAFHFQLQQASHGEHAETDRYLVTTGDGYRASPELRQLVEIVNAKKMELQEFTALLVEIERALAAEDAQSVDQLRVMLAQMADKTQYDLYNDITSAHEEVSGYVNRHKGN